MSSFWIAVLYIAWINAVTFAAFYLDKRAARCVVCSVWVFWPWWCFVRFEASEISEQYDTGWQISSNSVFGSYGCDGLTTQMCPYTSNLSPQ